MLDTKGDAIHLQPGQFLGKTTLERLLAQHAPEPGAPGSAMYLPPGAVAGFLAGSDPNLRDWREQLLQSGDPVLKSDTGIVGLRAGDRGLIILPPFPVPEQKLIPAWEASPLLELIATQYTVGVVLLRLGRYLVAVFEGERVASSKTDTRYVKGKHHAGGTSQLRFQRIREGQMRKLYDETCGVVRARFSPYARKLDYLLLGGERFTLNGFLKVCPYLEQYQKIT
ncbi:MAG: Vms1/Ankzf1 family peptidyl-tRNA hydrolase, partial [Dehalococcoidia bacterium]